MSSPLSLRFGGVATLYGDASLERFLRSRVAVIAVPRFFTEASAAAILDTGFDAVIDAIDTTRR